jgi:hypothetical protein
MQPKSDVGCKKLEVRSQGGQRNPQECQEDGSGRVDRMSIKYELALDRGTARGAKRASNKDVAQRYREGMEHSMAAVARVRSVLQGLGVNPLNYIRYVPFGQMLARFTRRYSALTLENLARGLVREWELRLSHYGVAVDPPDSVVLRAVCEGAFGIRVDRVVKP